VSRPTPRQAALFALSGLMDGWSLEKREEAIAQVASVIQSIQVDQAPLYRVDISEDGTTSVSLVDERIHQGTAAYEINYLRGYLDMPPESAPEEVRVKAIDRISSLVEQVDAAQELRDR
jgi:hypothetical protein